MENEKQNEGEAQAAGEDNASYTPEERDMLKRAGEACIDAMDNILGDREDLAHIVSGSLVGVAAFASDNPDRVLSEAFTVAYNAGHGHYFSGKELEDLRREIREEAERERDAGANMNNLCNSVDEGEKDV